MINFVLKIQENQGLLKVYRAISSFVQLIPYYVMEEVFSENQVDIAAKIENLEIVLLSREDMPILERHEECTAAAGEFVKRLERGCLCLAAKIRNEIASYSWCDLTCLSYKERTLRLKENEAYLFDARTYQKYRGKNIAPCIRQKLYRIMKDRGVEKFYSITLLSNSASMKFKKKLGSRPTELSLYVGLFKKLHMHLRLKRFPNR